MFLQICTSGVEVQLEGLATNADRAKVALVVLLRVGGDRAALHSSSGAHHVGWSHCADIGVLVVRLHHGDWTRLEDLASRHLFKLEGTAAHQLRCGCSDGESGRGHHGRRGNEGMHSERREQNVCVCGWMGVLLMGDGQDAEREVTFEMEVKHTYGSSARLSGVCVL